MYRFGVPPLLKRITSDAGQWVLHGALATLVPIPVAALLWPVFSKICPAPTLFEFTLSAVALSWAFVFAGLNVQRWRSRAEQSERLALQQRQALLETQLQALQARTHPHFFFNSLNTVASLIPEDPKLAERTLERLADLFRYALDASKTASVPLGKELELACDFLEIQKARFGNRLAVNVQLDEAAKEVQVPPLLLQPLIENAILHGLAERPRGQVTLTVRREGQKVLIDVTDDGPGPGASSHQGTQTSMRELRERLRLFWGEAQSFELVPNPGGGCLARLAIPLERVAT